MTTVTTQRPVNLDQLTAETGGAQLKMADHGTERTITALDGTLTAEQLQAAVDAHEPQPDPPSPLGALQQQVNELTDLLLFGF